MFLAPPKFLDPLLDILVKTVYTLMFAVPGLEVQKKFRRLKNGEIVQGGVIQERNVTSMVECSVG